MGILLIPKTNTMPTRKEEIEKIAESCGIYKYLQGQSFIDGIINNDAITVEAAKAEILKWMGLPQNQVVLTSEPSQKVPGQFYFDSEEEEAMGIETCEYENGGKVKRCTLSDGSIAVSRRLKGKDRILIKRLIGDQKERMEDAVTALSTKINDKEIVFEDIDNLWFNDAMAIQTMATTLNFM